MSAVSLRNKPALTLPRPTRDIEEGKRQLDEYGLAVHEGFLSPEQTQLLRDRLLEQAELEGEQGVALLSGQSRGGKTWFGHIEPGERPGWQGVPALYNKGRPFIDLVMDRRLHAYIGHAFKGVPFNLSALTGLIVRRGAEPMVVHADQQYVPFSTPTPISLNIMICLTEFEDVMGATRVVPGSHKGPFPKQAFDAERGVYNPEPIETVAVECSAGSAIFFESRTWHQSGISTSDKTRVSFSTLWSQFWVKPMDNIVENLHEDVYRAMSEEELAILGFRSDPCNRIEARSPTGRQNTNRKTPYAPELRRGGSGRAVPLDGMGDRLAAADIAQAQGLSDTPKTP